MNNDKMLNPKAALALLAVVALCGFLLGGCDSDSTAPDDELPTLSQNDVINQAALTAVAVAAAANTIVTYSGPSKELYSYDFGPSSDIQGTVNLDYYLGGAGGTSSTFALGDYCHMWTPEPAGLTMDLDTGGGAALSFDVVASIVQAQDTATIAVGSSGTFTSGDYSSSFTFFDLVVTTADYPTSGSMSFSGGAHTVTVTYDGDNTASLEITGEGTWSVNLDDGTITPPLT